MYRWLAPELIEPPPNANGMIAPVFTKEADVFAFGMVAVELFTGEVPFGWMNGNAWVLERVLMGTRPENPSGAGEVGLTDSMWELICRCWEQNPARRPTMKEVVRGLETLVCDDIRGGFQALIDEHGRIAHGGSGLDSLSSEV